MNTWTVCLINCYIPILGSVICRKILHKWHWNELTGLTIPRRQAGLSISGICWESFGCLEKEGNEGGKRAVTSASPRVSGRAMCPHLWYCSSAFPKTLNLQKGKGRKRKGITLVLASDSRESWHGKGRGKSPGMYLWTDVDYWARPSSHFPIDLC